MSDPVTPLTPPAATAELKLTPPAPVTAVAPEKVGGMITVDEAALPGLDEKVETYVDSVLALDVHSPAFSAKANDVRTMGDDEIRAARLQRGRESEEDRTRQGGAGDEREHAHVERGRQADRQVVGRHEPRQQPAGPHLGKAGGHGRQRDEDQRFSQQLTHQASSAAAER